MNRRAKEGCVAAKASGVIRALDLALWGGWGWILICIGPCLVYKLPGAHFVDARWPMMLCAAFVASGLFVFAHRADRCFPGANRWLRLAGVTLPWIGLAGVLIGGSI